MKFLLLNQCFYPDVVATAQHLTDLATELSARGHDVTVIASDRGYDDPQTRFPRRETWRNISIIRLPSLSLGKSSRWQRALNFASFMIMCALRLLVMRRCDVVVALTSPPLISFLGALFVRLKGGKFCFWVMDLNPDEAIAAGWLDKRSFAARVLQRMLRYSLKQADRTIVLDRFMRERVVAKGAVAERVSVIPPGAIDDAVRFSLEGRETFRRAHELTDRFVVMYAGNHSPCHPLDTLLEAARRLKTRDDVAFCFVGGGSEHGKVKEFARRHELRTVKCLPYQPLDGLAGMLSAADLHVVVMGDEFVGIVHPSKVYNIMVVGAPVVYVGPAASHVADIAAENSGRFFLHRHGDVEGVVASVVALSEELAKLREPRDENLKQIFSKQNFSKQEFPKQEFPKQEFSKQEFSKQVVLAELVSAIGGNTVENLLRALPDSDNRLTDYHAAH